MKKNTFLHTLLFSMLAVFTANNALQAQGSLASDSVVMGASYANEIYYNMANGQVLSSPRKTWDIAFRTKKFSSSILTNDGSGVVLYTYPKSDTSGWSGVDTSGLYNWTPMYNDAADWENGAFSRNAKGHPDYGWAIYNDVTHDLVADSLFIIKLRDGSFRKLWIRDKRSVQDIYHFRYANVDGTNDQTMTLDLSNDLLTDFIGFSIESGQRVDYQPPIASWDIVFSKYIAMLPGGGPTGNPYPVVGVFGNPVLKTKTFRGVPLTYDNWQVNPWDSAKSSIGYDWKAFNNATSTYKIVDSLVYFVKPLSKDVYKLYFTAYEGSVSGKINFTKEKLLSYGITDIASSGLAMKVFPNPVNQTMHISVAGKPGNEIHIVLSDLSGRQLGADHPGRPDEGLNQFSFDVSGFIPGVYFVTVLNAGTRTVAKVIIKR